MKRPTWQQATHDWRWGVPLVVVALVVGLLVGFVGNKATAAPALFPVCDNCAISVVRTPHRGALKFKHGKLGRAPARVHYPRNGFRRVVGIKVARAHNRHVSGRGQWTRAQAWRYVTRHDTCVSGADVEGWGAPTSRGGPITCEGQAYLSRQTGGWHLADVSAFFCAVGFAVAVGAAQEAGSGPWGWAAIGVGTSSCMWAAIFDRLD